jgi:hypothetical protein
MFKKFIILGVTALSMVATSAIAADASRARLMVPISTSAGDDDQPDETASVSGYGLHYVSSMGVGAGVSSVAVEIGTVKTTANFLDISYTFGDSFTTQLAFGYPYGGDLENEGSEIEFKSISGQALSLNFGYDFGGFEALVGFMSESTKQKYEMSMEILGTTFTQEGEYERTALHTSAGIGFTF